MIDTFHFTFTFTFNLLIFFLLALLMFMEYMYSVYGRDPKYLSYLYVIENKETLNYINDQVIPFKGF